MKVSPLGKVTIKYQVAASLKEHAVIEVHWPREAQITRELVLNSLPDIVDDLVCCIGFFVFVDDFREFIDASCLVLGCSGQEAFL